MWDGWITCCPRLCHTEYCTHDQVRPSIDLLSRAKWGKYERVTHSLSRGQLERGQHSCLSSLEKDVGWGILHRPPLCFLLPTLGWASASISFSPFAPSYHRIFVSQWNSGCIYNSLHYSEVCFLSSAFPECSACTSRSVSMERYAKHP